MINSRKRFKLFNKAMDFFITLGFEIKYVHLFESIIQFRVYNNRFEVRKHYIFSIANSNFTIEYIRINCKHLKYKQKENSKNYKIK